MPEVQPIVPVCLFHHRVKSTVRAQIEFIPHVREITIHSRHVGVKPGACSVKPNQIDKRHARLQLLPPWVLFCPRPLFPELGERQFIFWYVTVHPCAGVPVPVPCPSQVRSCIDHRASQPEFAQVDELMDAAESCADDDGVILFFFRHG